MTQTQVDKRCGRQFKEARCETMENKTTEQRRMGINYKGSQGQTERAVALQEEEEEEEEDIGACSCFCYRNTLRCTTP